ncbi:MAG: hypothetical protein KFW09_01555 [Oscillospiraceae bacterium]|nr:hypothetical protein [Oscillospiraceae bacterium]
MEEMINKLKEILETDEGKENLKNILSGIGNSKESNNIAIDNEKKQKEEGFDISSLANILSTFGKEKKISEKNSDNNENMLGNLLSNLDTNKLSGLLSSFGKNNNIENNNPLGGLGNMDMGMLLKLQPLMSSMGKEDKNTRLMDALKEHVKPSRVPKIEQALNIMKMMTMLPMLKEIGLFGGE